MNIYRITQEAVNNAMKYAEAKNILLNAKSVDHQVQITVTDDGRGFDIDETELETESGIWRKEHQNSIQHSL
jgi:signal transduction histidine kinase